MYIYMDAYDIRQAQRKCDRNGGCGSYSGGDDDNNDNDEINRTGRRACDRRAGAASVAAAAAPQQREQLWQYLRALACVSV